MTTKDETVYVITMQQGSYGKEVIGIVGRKEELTPIMLKEFKRYQRSGKLGVEEGCMETKVQELKEDNKVVLDYNGGKLTYKVEESKLEIS